MQQRQKLHPAEQLLRMSLHIHTAELGASLFLGPSAP